MKLYKIFEYGYIAIAIFCVIQTFLKFNVDRNRAYFFLIFGVFAIFMFFFKRWFRKNRFEKRD
jgi:hypothetical protein